MQISKKKYETPYSPSIRLLVGPLEMIGLRIAGQELGRPLMENHLCEKYKLEDNSCTADNTGGNLDGVKRMGNKRVFRKVQSDLDIPNLGISGLAHLVHSSVQIACDSLPRDHC
ncbi:hypothetical protein TNIN_133601 [Trichonephila inaurata madagascariensis]|uniref:Uncharacterized protein n=1 Tax=Trichonephila inaurata madagascariensis TaxID=2747483 RepID=A0A8X7BXA8_9ARAC|nr:hypothetical protein TNIN_74771 [Trichonephila inaurata madagascariensis]GFY69518.1 hypothetical protein TNIN_133601 [Trichonephila inaurata madagascariensis]